MLWVIILLILLFGGFGGYGYSRRADWGPAPMGIGTILVIILIIWLVTGGHF
jgi:hypothetical protein